MNSRGSLVVSVTVQNLVKRFGSYTAVDNISFEVRDKEFLVLLGPSGCGKTTTLNIIAGLEDPTQGSLYFDGQMVNNVPPDKRNVAMVFQNYALYPHKTAYDNIAFPLKVKKLQKSEIDRQVKRAAEMLRITRLLPKKPHEMSGGERQRVALARATVRNPNVFLLDEPLSNIDAQLRVHMRAELIRLQKTLKTTTIYVTHDQVEAMTMADRVAVMDQGKLLQLDEPLNIFDRPASTFVGAFVGTPPMNLIDCVFTIENSEAFLQATAFKIRITPDLTRVLQGQPAGSEFVIGMRPRDVVLSKQKFVDGRSSFETEVYVVEPLGAETIVDLTINDSLIKSIVDPSFHTQVGEKVWVAFKQDRVHVFDKKSQKLIV